MCTLSGASSRNCDNRIGAEKRYLCDGTFGDMTEQLASRQAIAHNRGFFQTAHELYIRDGKLKRGASSKPKKPKERKPGDRTGMGSVRRLAIALQRLDLTYDTEVMELPQMRMVLPREFARWGSAITNPDPN